MGDSLNRNMWESLVCILRHSLRRKKRVFEISGRREFKKKGFYAFRFEAILKSFQSFISQHRFNVDLIGTTVIVVMHILFVYRTTTALWTLLVLHLLLENHLSEVAMDHLRR